MKKLTSILENPFDDPDIKWTRLLSFATDHLQRMIANNTSGELNARITATTNALTLVGQNASDDETKLGLRMARKQAKDVFRASLLPRVAKLAGALTAKFGPDSEQMTECFPQGRSIFSTSTDDAMAGHIEAMKTAMTAYSAQLGTEAMADLKALATGWATVHSKSEESAANKTASRESKRLARENLQLMLFLNLLKLAEMFARQPDQLTLYMQQSLLEVPTQSDDGEAESSSSSSSSEGG